MLTKGLGYNEKYVDGEVRDKKGKKIGKITRIGKLVKVDKYSKSKYKYKVRIAPGSFIYLKKF